VQARLETASVIAQRTAAEEVEEKLAPQEMTGGRAAAPSAWSVSSTRDLSK
jgi:hypothetical protein